MQRKTTVISIDNLDSNTFLLNLSGRRFTAVGVSDDHVVQNIQTLDRDLIFTPPLYSDTTTTTTTTPDPSENPSPRVDRISIASSTGGPIFEGGNAKFRVETSNIDDGTLLYYQLTPANEFVTSQGTIEINNNISPFTSFSASSDSVAQGDRNGTITIRINSFTGPQLGTQNIIIKDVPPTTTTTTTTTPAPGETTTPEPTTTTTTTTPEPTTTTTSTTTTTTTTPDPNEVTFNLIAPDSIVEGETGVVTLATTRVPDGAVYYWNLTPAENFEVSTGTVTINSNLGSFVVQPELGSFIEGSINIINVNVRTGPFPLGSVLDSDTFEITQAFNEVTTTTTTPEPTTTPDPSNPTTTPIFIPAPAPATLSVEAQDPLQEIDDQCSRIVFNQDFDPKKDIYVSFQTPKLPRLITEDSKFVLLTEDGDILLVDNVSNVTLFLADGTKEVDTNPYNGNPGKGGGLLALLDTLNPNMSGHLMSMCVDFLGEYGLKNTFSNSGNKGNTLSVPNSITARLSTTSSEYDFLSTIHVPNFNILNTDFRTFRFVFKEHLSKIRVDFKTEENEIYETVFEADTFVTMSKLVSSVKIGIASSGNENFGIKDITYSGDLA